MSKYYWNGFVKGWNENVSNPFFRIYEYEQLTDFQKNYLDTIFEFNILYFKMLGLSNDTGK